MAMEFLVCADGIWEVTSTGLQCSGDIISQSLEQISETYVPEGLFESYSHGFVLITFGWFLGFCVRRLMEVIRSIK